MTRHPRTRSSLEFGTKLGGPKEARWSFALYPEAAEGGGSFRSLGPRTRALEHLADPDRIASDAARRARAKVRRYCAANRLNRLGTLTYGPRSATTRDALRLDLADFSVGCAARLEKRSRTSGCRSGMPAGQRLHAHFAVGRWIAQSAIQSCLGPRLRTYHAARRPTGRRRGRWARHAKLRATWPSTSARISAGSTAVGLHRYEVAQGFQPRAVPIRGASADEVIGWADTYMGAPGRAGLAFA